MNEQKSKAWKHGYSISINGRRLEADELVRPLAAMKEKEVVEYFRDLTAGYNEGVYQRNKQLLEKQNEKKSKGSRTR